MLPASTPLLSPFATPQPVGLLLAGGRGTRFDPSGQQNKLLAPLVHGANGAQVGLPVAWLAALHMKAALVRVIAVLRPDGVQAETLARLLQDAGCEVLLTQAAQRGMGASLAAGVEASSDAAGWVIALADMPALAPSTITAVGAALSTEQTMAAAWYRGMRGHPVGFGRGHRAALMQLDGDTGARALLQQGQVLRIDTDDAGVLRDIDTPAAL
jgi:molybdenum cofactor cytidylyltransferase